MTALADGEKLTIKTHPHLGLSLIPREYSYDGAKT